MSHGPASEEIELQVSSSVLSLVTSPSEAKYKREILETQRNKAAITRRRAGGIPGREEAEQGNFFFLINDGEDLKT